jgi:hypothetical protein
MKYTNYAAIFVAAFAMTGFSKGTVLQDDFSTDTSANYTGSNSYGSGGSFTVDAGDSNEVRILTGGNNTYSVAHTTSSLDVGESYAIDFLDARTGESGGAGNGLFLMLTTGTGQAGSSGSSGFRLRLDTFATIRLATYSANGTNSTVSSSISPSAAPDTFWVDRTTATDFEFYYGSAGSRTLITTGSLHADDVDTETVHVGFQAFGGSTGFSFDNLRVGPATWPSITDFSVSSETLTGPGSVTFTWSTHNTVSATLNGVDVTGQSPLTLTVNESGDYTLAILGTDGSTTSQTIQIEVEVILPFNLAITQSAATPGAYDFTWDSQPGELYDLCSSTGLSTPRATWSVWDGNTGIPGSAGTTTTLTDVPEGDDPRRFFVVKKVSLDPWVLASMGDTQVLVQTATGRQVFSDNTQWLADNKASLNLAFVTQLGDVVENGKYGRTTVPPSSTDNVDEWNGADAAMSNLDGVVGWGTAIGNHEFDWVDVISGTTPSGAWLTPTPASGFEGWKARFGPATTNRYAAMPEFGGVATNDVDTYFKYTAAGREYLHLHLQVDIPDDTITWAQSIIDANPGLPTLISTHVFEGTAHGPPNNPYLSGPDRNSANDVWNELIKDNSQIFMVLSGHTGQQQRQTRTNTAGEPVFTIVQDYAGSDRNASPSGYLRTYEFDEENDIIHVTTYSPTHDTFLTGTAHQFDLPLDFDARFAP